MIHFFEDDRIELYNLHADPGETHNLAAEKPNLAHQLKTRLLNWQEQVEAKIPQKNLLYNNG